MLILLFLPIFCIIAHRINRDCALPARGSSESLNPRNTIFIFDIHGVLFTHDYLSMLDTFWRSPMKWRLIKTVLDPRFIYHMVKVSWHSTLAEAFFLYFDQTAPGTADVWKLFIEIANCQRVNWPMIKLVHRLKDQGYQLGILSDISDEVFLDLEERFASIFALFDPIITTSAYNKFVTKPNPQVYKHLLQELDMHESVMFIDDNQKNVCGSLPFGIIALRYTNIHKLKDQLATLGIDVLHKE